MKIGQNYIGVSVGATILNDKNQVLLSLLSKNCRNERGKYERMGWSCRIWRNKRAGYKRGKF